MIKFALITLLSLSYTLKKPNVGGVGPDYLYEVTWEGSHHDSTWIWSRERGDKFRGYRHGFHHLDWYSKFVDEPAGSVDINYQEFGWKPTFQELIKNKSGESLIKLKLDTSLRYEDWETPGYWMGGVLLESGFLKTGYKTDFQSKESFFADLGTRVAFALLGKGFWYMPELYYTSVNGEEDYRIKQTVGIEWR